MKSSISKTQTHYFWIVVFLLAVAGILTRIPFQANILHHWDSVNFALALDEFNIREHQPHPPGTFVIYILLGRLLNTFIHNPNTSLVWLSTITNGLGIAALCALCNQLFSSRTAIITGLLALVSPLVWFHGEVALSYMLEFFWVPLVVYYCYKMNTKSKWAILISALLIGLAGGIRPNTPVFLSPLWIGAALINRYKLKEIIVGVFVMGCGVLLWAIPMIIMTGGLAEFIETALWWQAQHTEDSASLVGILEYMSRFAAFLFYTVGLGVFIIIIAIIRYVKEIPDLWKTWEFQVMALWIIPGTLYLTIVHIRQSGHMFTIIPAYIILTAISINVVSGWVNRFSTTTLPFITALIVISNLAFFLFSPAYLFGINRMILNTPSWNTIREYDLYVTTRLDAIQANFSPDHTAVLTSSRDMRIPDFYLPQYQRTDLSYEIEKGTIELSSPIDTLVIFDESSLPPLSDEINISSFALPDGRALYFVNWDAGQTLVVSRSRLSLADNN